MNLAGSRAYLVGPMDRVKDNGVGWRRKITPMLQELDVKVLDPTNKPIKNHTLPGVAREEKKYKKQYKEHKDYDGLTNLMKIIRHVDLRMTDICDFVIAYLNMDAAMCGTWEEIFNVNRQKKPVLCIIDGGKDAMPDWLFGVLPHHHFFDSIEECMVYLKGINDGSIEMDKRWTLLDQTMMEAL